MTSQIVLMNKLGLAVASDSSLTMTRGDNRRTYASAEKIFPLGPDHKVAILHSGVVEFMGHPFEVLLTEWAKSLQRPYGTLDEYAESFCNWLAHRQDLFSEESQANFLNSLLKNYLLDVRATILERLDEASVSEEDWATTEVLDKVNDILDRDIKYLDGLMELQGLNAKWADSHYQSLQSPINEAIEYVFDDVPRNEVSDSKYEEIAKRVLYKRIYSRDHDARLAFVGYGEQTIYPMHTWIDFQGVVGDKPRHVSESLSISTDTNSYLKTHAQDEAIHTFLRAYHPTFFKLAAKYQSETIDLILEMLDSASNETAVEVLYEKIAALGEKRQQGINEEFEKTSESDFIDPFTSTLSGLPSTSLAKMAESLIELQILRQSSQAIQDTVGGPVDVAVITLEKGFQWFRHKTLEDLWGNL
jgi:hypothetical protein